MQNSLSFDRSHSILLQKIEIFFFLVTIQKSNGGSKNESFTQKLNHIVWPIKWKGILHRLTIWSQKICQYNSVESSMKMGPIFFYFEDYSKSARWMILFWLFPCYHTPTLHKKAEKPPVILFFTQIFIKSTVWWEAFVWVSSQILYSNRKLFKLHLPSLKSKNNFGLMWRTELSTQLFEI